MLDPSARQAAMPIVSDATKPLLTSPIVVATCKVDPSRKTLSDASDVFGKLIALCA
jgi:hypothetical protein